MEEEQEIVARIRKPKRGEIFGIIISMLGASKVTVECEDGKTRVGRIRGKIRKRKWVRPGDLVLLKPWIVQSDERADIIWGYSRTEANWLRKKGFAKNLEA